MRLFFLSLLFTINGLLIAQDFKDLPKSLDEKVFLELKENKVTLGDFWYVFNKNNYENTVPNAEDLQNYLELYKIFKLKVEAAKDAGLNKTDAFKKELEGYKNQLDESYLTDKSVTEDLVKEAYDRYLNEVKASHILIQIPELAMPSDTLQAFNKIKKIKKEIEEGADFNEMAEKHSDDPSAAKNKGDLGYFTVFQMVYPFESAAYNTKVGEVSDIFKTRFGYHLVKVFNKKEIKGSIKVAHIMVVDEKHEHKAGVAHDHSSHEKKEQKIKEVYEKLENGEPFEVLAKKYSEHTVSARKGGELSWFSGNKYDAAFVEKAYALKNNGDYSEPFRSEYGWHIVKRIDFKPVNSFDEMENNLKQKINKSDRADLPKASVINKLKEENDFKEKSKNLKVFYEIANEKLITNEWKRPDKVKLKKTLFKLNGKKYKQKDFADYLESHTYKTRNADYIQLVNHLYNLWINELLEEIEINKLSEKYPDYSRLLQEYSDGIILFELTDKKVWSKAINDTSGLEAFYQKNKNKWMWEERINGKIFKCDNEKDAEQVKYLLEQGMESDLIIKRINEQSQLKVKLDSGIFDASGFPVLNDIEYKSGISKVVKNSESYYVVVVDKVLKPAPKTLKEARGAITAAYQEELMNEWIEELREKYEIKVYEETFTELVNYVKSLN